MSRPGAPNVVTSAPAARPTGRLTNSHRMMRMLHPARPGRQCRLALATPLLYKGEDFSQTDIALVGRREERRRLSEALASYG